MGQARFNQGRLLGFTLVEMLLVVAIIAVLIAILLPTLNRSREVTRYAICAARLGQIGNAVISYRTDSNRFGLVEYNQSAAAGVNDNMVSLTRYVSGFDMFICPSTRNTVTKLSHLRARPAGSVGNFSSFESYGTFDNRKIKTPMNCRGLESQIWLVYDQDNPQDNWFMNPADNHGADGGNVLHGDAHVQWYMGAKWYASRLAAQTLR